MRDMTTLDRTRLRAHVGSHKLFRALLQGASDGYGCRVAELSKTQWNQLRTLLELGFADVDDARVIIPFTISSLSRLGYIG